MRPSISNWMSSTAVHFRKGKVAGSPHSRKKKRLFSCRFHPRRMRQPYGPQKRSRRITCSQQAVAGTPYHMKYIGRKVDIRTTEKCVEVSSHVRIFNAADPVYVPERMPEAHRRYLNYNEESFRQWAEDIGPSTGTVIRPLLQNGQDKVKNDTMPRTTGSYGLTHRATRE